MKFTETSLVDAFVVDIEAIEDERGFFARGWCRREFEARGLPAVTAQANISFSKQRGTLRGLHWQEPPHAENKLVRCMRGGIFDVAVDLRPGSPTYLKWFGVELTDKNHRMLLVPEGFAHGFQTLEDRTEVFYMVSEFYAPKFEQGARYDDPAFRIEWPLDVTEISDKDSSWPRFEKSRNDDPHR
jgi:dTDP-4-dehydrorhamnose 3,5-epimerase